MRVALGASHWRIVRLLLVESLLFSGLGAAGGLLLGRIGRDVLVAAVPVRMPAWMNFDIDAGVGLFAAALAVGTALIFGLVPALRTSRPNLQDGLRTASAKSVTASRSRLRSFFVAAEVSLALLLLIGGSLMTRSVFNLIRRDPGFRPENVLTLRITVPRAAYPDENAVRNFYSPLLDRLRVLPGVQQVGATRVLPTKDAAWVPQIIPDGTVASAPRGIFVANQVIVTPGYFGVLGIRVLRGRGFNAQQDGPDAPGVVIVNDSFVRRHWPTGDPIGRRLRYRMGPSDESPWLTVIDVVSDVQYRDSNLSAATYLPHQQRPSRTMCLALKTASDPSSLTNAVRQVIAQADPNIPCVDVQTMEEILSTSLWQPRLL